MGAVDSVFKEFLFVNVYFVREGAARSHFSASRLLHMALSNTFSRALCRILVARLAPQLGVARYLQSITSRPS